MNSLYLQSLRRANGYFFSRSLSLRSPNYINQVYNKSSYGLTEQIRHYSRRARFSTQKYNFYITYGKPTAFVVGGIGVTYSLAMIISEERTKHAMKQYPAFFNRGMRQIGYGANWNDLWRHYEMLIRSKCQHENNPWSRLKAWWLSIDPSYRCLIPIVGLNCLVYLLWKVPRLNYSMSRYFICRGHSSPISLLLSTFSHQSGWHILANMLALVSFGRLVIDDLGRDQFYAFYLSSGMFASYISYIAKFLFKTASIGSLGASGAVYAVAALAIKNNPNLSVSLVFLPFFSISGMTALLGLAVYDLIGLFSRRSMFDHPAHLAGMAFGYCYYPIHDLLWVRYRKWLITHYRRIRSSFVCSKQENNLQIV